MAPAKPTKTLKTGRKPGSGRPKGAISLHQNPTCTLTQNVLDEFVAIVRKGNFRQVARQRLGISPSTYDKWIRTGKKQIREVESGKRKTLLLQGKLMIALDEAEGYIHGQMVEDILDQGSIQARQWFLERRFNKQYSKNPNAHLDDETGKETAIDPMEMLAEKLKVLLGHDG